jgi:hypothetical protein
MGESNDEWFKEYRRLTFAIKRFFALREPLRILEDLDYYWNAALINSGDVFGYMHFIIEHQADFEAIGAKGTLDAMVKLRPFYRQQQKLADHGEKHDYWRRTRDERAAAEELAEGVHEFGRLLLAFAEKNLRLE